MIRPIGGSRAVLASVAPPSLPPTKKSLEDQFEADPQHLVSLARLYGYELKDLNRLQTLSALLPRGVQFKLEALLRSPDFRGLNDGQRSAWLDVAVSLARTPVAVDRGTTRGRSLTGEPSLAHHLDHPLEALIALPGQPLMTLPGSGGLTAFDQLARLALVNHAALGDVVRELADPGRVSQEDAHASAATLLQVNLIVGNPGEYTRIVSDLLLCGETTLGDGSTHVKANAHTGARSSESERVFQGSLTRHFAPPASWWRRVLSFITFGLVAAQSNGSRAGEAERMWFAATGLPHQLQRIVSHPEIATRLLLQVVTSNVAPLVEVNDQLFWLVAVDGTTSPATMVCRTPTSGAPQGTTVLIPATGTVRVPITKETLQSMRLLAAVL